MALKRYRVTTLVRDACGRRTVAGRPFEVEAGCPRVAIGRALPFVFGNRGGAAGRWRDGQLDAGERLVVICRRVG